MSPGPFDLCIQHGILGGFIPPRPSAVHNLSFKPPGNPHILLTSQFPYPSGGVTAQQLDSKPKSIQISDDTTNLVKELEDILRKLPTEEVPSNDIYGRNIGIFWQGADGFAWANSAPQGCGRFDSGIVVTEDHKKDFGRAVEITETLVQRGVAHESAE
ncbi:hypothetical protein EDB83DRAFT_2505323 [Lactarius deliciosus]|nr:hypothetical protein EDB83DRAFT_2505323 [Lactarius deliciosus]